MGPPRSPSELGWVMDHLVSSRSRTLLAITNAWNTYRARLASPVKRVQYRMGLRFFIVVHRITAPCSWMGAILFIGTSTPCYLHVGIIRRHELGTGCTMGCRLVYKLLQ